MEGYHGVSWVEGGLVCLWPRVSMADGNGCAMGIFSAFFLDSNETMLLEMTIAAQISIQKSARARPVHSAPAKKENTRIEKAKSRPRKPCKTGAFRMVAAPALNIQDGTKRSQLHGSYRVHRSRFVEFDYNRSVY